MTSIIKVDQIQTSSGNSLSVPSAGMLTPYFIGYITTASYSAGTQHNYTLTNFATSNSDTLIAANNQTITINKAGVWKIDLTLTGVGTDSTSSRFQENYIYKNSTKVLDVRAHVNNIDTNYEYYTCSGSVIVTCASGDTITALGNGQRTWNTNLLYGSNISGTQLS
jgi:hypothetical protein